MTLLTAVCCWVFRSDTRQPLVGPTKSRPPRQRRLNLAVGFNPLPLPTFFTICGRGFQPADAGGRIEPGVERQRNPRIWRKYASSPRSGRQLFVMRHFIIIEIGPMAVARSAGLCDKS